MSGIYAEFNLQRFTGETGGAVGALIFFYQTGTTVLADIYADQELTEPLENPVPVAAGEIIPDIWLDPTITYRRRIVYNDGTVSDQDPFENGSTFVASGSGAVARNTEEKLRDIVSVKDFGAKGDGANDDTAAFNSALAAHKNVTVPAGTYNVTTITMALDGTMLSLDAGAIVNLQDATINGLQVSGDDCSIIGPGVIKSPAVFNGTNSRRTYATVWVTGDALNVDSVTFENIPRAGVHFEDATNGRISNCYFKGNYPYADYNEATTTAQIAVDYNPPTSGGSTSATGNGSLVVVGNRIEKCIQGVFVGNFDSAADEVGVVVVGNSFNQCWDHGVYMTVGEAYVINGNSFLNCRRPVAVDGLSGVISHNSFYATETSRTNGQQDISVREPSDTSIIGNTFYGPSAGIAVDCVSGTEIKRIRIADNIIRRVGSGLANNIIRVGQGAQVCEDVVIENNTISGSPIAASGAAIFLTTASSSFKAVNSAIRNNTILIDGTINVENAVIQANDHDDLMVKGNTIRCTASSSSSGVIRGFFFAGCARHVIRGNRFLYRTGGTGITLRVIQTNTVGTVDGNFIDVSSGSLTSPATLDFVQAGSFVSRNQINATEGFTGAITIASGAASGAVTNNNVRAAWSSVTLTPTDNGGAALLATPGVKTVLTDNTITISTADGTNAPTLASYRYVLS